ncbi:hypothetical protein GDO78_015995 [Eleutherodactylus coqui]|uniref:Uncharacterized protein n=1 Tax=Eleutherodactylus coqui TaxID=57060 RepID=A0A8J6ELE9_ELECQ|nr:hypothetical protein GDO78_015995 [Eleutherodactylus coqui]
MAAILVVIWVVNALLWVWQLGIVQCILVGHQHCAGLSPRCPKTKSEAAWLSDMQFVSLNKHFLGGTSIQLGPQLGASRRTLQYK